MRIWETEHPELTEKLKAADYEMPLSENILCQTLEKIEDLYTTMERFSTIYISKHHHNIHIKSSTFSENIGTYGGALNLQSFSARYGNYKLLYN